RRRHTRSKRDWSSDVCSSDLGRLRPRRRRVPLDQPHGHVRPPHRRRLRHPSRPSPALAGTRSRPCGDDEGAGDHGGRSIRGRGMSDPGYGKERRRTAMSEKTEPLSAADRAYRVIRSQILSGVHAPGTRLGESALAAEIEVSRTPVRVALARLQDEGWILIYPKRGAIVQGIDERTIVELADARYVLETTA